MSHTYVLLDDYRRRMALRAVQLAKEGSQVEITRFPKRTLEQNRWLHRLLSDIAEQMTDPEVLGEFRPVEWWKPRTTLSWIIEKHQEYEVVTAFNSHEFGVLIPHTSDLKADQCAEYIEWLYAFGAQNGVKFTETRPPDPPPPETDR